MSLHVVFSVLSDNSIHAYIQNPAWGGTYDMTEEQKQYKVLIAEDDTPIRKSMVSFIGSSGYEILEAKDGRQALQLLRDQKPDVLLTDLRMSGLDGAELLRISLKELPLTQIIIISGMGPIDDAIELLRLGAFDYITKPVLDMGLVLHSVQKSLGHAEFKKREEEHQRELEFLVQQRTLILQEQNRQLEQEVRRRQVRESLVLQAEQELERTVDAMPAMIALIDINNQVIRTNRAMRNKIGVLYGDAQIPMDFPCFHCEQGLQEQCPHVKTMKDGREHNGDFYESQLDCHLEVTTVPYNDPDGTLIGLVYIATDITDRKRQQENYERLFEASRDAIVVTNQDGFLDCNQAALEMFGYTVKEEFLLLHPAEVSPQMQPDGLSSRQSAQQRIADAIEEGGGTSFQWEHRRRDGTVFPAEVLLSPFKDGGDWVVQGVVRDLSKRQLEEKEKERLHARLLHAQKLESVGQLASGIAHEINTPTQFIGTNIDFIDDAVKDIGAFVKQLGTIAASASKETRDKIGEALEEADWEFLSEELPLAVSQSREGVERVGSIVRAMKEFSHPGSKEKESQNLNRIINTTVTVARNEWKYVSEVILDLDPNLPEIQLLVDEMGQVVLNLLVNASHAIADTLGANQEGKKGTITITTKKRGDWVDMTIRDTGKGIPKEIQSRIFDPFYTTKVVGKGTGQGLAIAHDVVVKHDGEIRVESIVGEGSTFLISLPLGGEGEGIG